MEYKFQSEKKKDEESNSKDKNTNIFFSNGISTQDSEKINFFVRKVQEENTLDAWKELYGLIFIEGFSDILKNECTIDLLSFAILNFGTDKEKDLFILRTIIELFNFDNPQIKQELITEFLNKIIFILENTENKKITYMIIVEILPKMVPMIIDLYDDCNDRLIALHNLIYQLIFQWSIDPTFRQSDLFELFCIILKNINIPDSQLQPEVDFLLKRLERMDNTSISGSILKCFFSIAKKNENVRLQIISSGIVQKFAISIDPMELPRECINVCNLLCLITVSEEEDSQFLEGFDIVEKYTPALFQNYDQYCIKPAILMCFAKLSECSSYVRQQVYENSILNDELAVQSFQIKAALVKVISVLMKYSSELEISLSDALVDVVFTVAESSSTDFAADALFIISTMLKNGYDGEIEVDLDSLVDSDDVRVSEAATEILQQIEESD